jgi:hypothetical protein
MCFAHGGSWRGWEAVTPHTARGKRGSMGRLRPDQGKRQTLCLLSRENMERNRTTHDKHTRHERAPSGELWRSAVLHGQLCSTIRQCRGVSAMLQEAAARYSTGRFRLTYCAGTRHRMPGGPTFATPKLRMHGSRPLPRLSLSRPGSDRATPERDMTGSGGRCQLGRRRACLRPNWQTHGDRAA